MVATMNPLQAGIMQPGAYANGQLDPQGILGGLLGSVGGGLAGRAIGGLFGNPQLGGSIGNAAGGIFGGLLPFEVDPLTAAYGGQLAPQGAVGNFLGGIAPGAGGVIGGLLGNRQLGHTFGQAASPLLRLLPFEVDPMAAAYGGQLAPQGLFGNILGGIAPTLGGAVGGLFGNARLGQQIGQAASPFARLLPFEVDPLTAAYGGQLTPQGAVGNFFPRPISSMMSDYPYSIAGQRSGQPLGRSLLPFEVDPLTAAYGGQLAPQGAVGNFLGGIAPGAGGVIGGLLGNRQLGHTIGQAASPLLRLLPFGVDPMAAAYGGQLAPQGAVGNFLGGIAPGAGNLIGGLLGNRQLGGAIGQAASPLLRLLPFEVDPMAAAYGGQLAPQGAVGNFLGGIAPGAGGVIGGLLGNRQLGHTIGQAASPLLRLLPFEVDPLTAAYGW